MQFVATCLFGLEKLLGEEIDALGCKRIETIDGRITFEGEPADIPRANIALRCAERVFVHLGAFPASSFAELFDGGKAELVLDDPQDVLECNINIRVQPPGKNVQNIDLLSGGEKGLAAIALLFAILKVTPAPFCIFDEVEAALDDINVSRYAQYVRNMTDRTQFILITHRRGTMDEADMLYGVTMQEKGVSKLLELKTAEMAKKLGLE